MKNVRAKTEAGAAPPPALPAKETLRPANAEELQDIVLATIADAARLRVCGMDSKFGWAQACNPSLSASGETIRRQVLNMRGFAGVDLYEPEELVLRAGAGTSMAEIETLLRENGQQLAFEPPQIAPLHGGDPGGTLGGVMGCNLSGPRRVARGAARDNILGIEAVSGRGELFHSGGRVVKNVTGYDLSKFLTGSHGTLAALTKITLKVLPASESSATLALFSLSAGPAVGVMRAALSSPCDVTGAAFLPAAVAAVAAKRVTAIGGEKNVAVLRLEGDKQSLTARLRMLQDLLAQQTRDAPAAPPVSSRPDMLVLGDEESRALWSFIADASCFAVRRGGGDVPPIGGDVPPIGGDFLWRLFLPPARGHHIARLVHEMSDEMESAQFFLDWGGGLGWLCFTAADAEAQTLCRRIAAFAAEHGGHGILLRAPASLPALRREFGGFAALGEAEMALTKRLRHAFDPHGILSLL